MAKIKTIIAREILDSNTNPALAGKLVLDNDKEVYAAVSRPTNQEKSPVQQLYDGDLKRFGGHGLTKAIFIANKLITPKLKGVAIDQQQALDYWLTNKVDGTKDKSRIGVLTTLLFSRLIARAIAVDRQQPLYQSLNQEYQKITKTKLTTDQMPTPIFNIIDGQINPESGLEFKEFQIVPSSSSSYEKSLQIGVQIYRSIKNTFRYRNIDYSRSNIGTYISNLGTNLDPLEILNETIDKQGLRIGLDVFLGVTVNGQFFFRDNHYYIKEKPHPLDKKTYLKYISQIIENYTILYLEDPLANKELADWVKINEKFNNIYLSANNLIGASKEKLDQIIKEKACNSIVINPTQIGTITEILNLAATAKKNNLTYTVASYLSNTTDSFNADLAFAIQAEMVKFGAPFGEGRILNHNRLWDIEREIKSQ